MRISGRIALYAAAIGGVLLVAAGWLALRLWSAVSHPGYPTTQVPRAWRLARESPGHLAHVEDAKVPCRDCHDLAKGVTPPPPGTCEGCHADVTTPLHASPMAAGVPCTGCHDFQGAHGANASPWGCLGCHAEPQGFETRAVQPHGDAPCATCHRPHTSPSLAPPDCGECPSE